jgi:hypothetical protein
VPCSSPVKEVVYAVRAISPLLVALVLLVVVVLRQPLPSKGFTESEGQDSPSAQGCSSTQEAEGAASGTDVDAAGSPKEQRGPKDVAGPAGGAGADTDTDIEQGHDQVGVLLQRHR